MRFIRVVDSTFTSEIGEDVIELLQTEAFAAHRKHGKGSILNGEKTPEYVLACGMEELGEVARAMVENEGEDRIIAEWIQVANVALSAVEVRLRARRGRP